MATEPRNAYEYSGALGGLIAGDRELRVREADKLAAESQMLLNATTALELDLASKYKEKGILADLKQKQAAARREAVLADVAEATRQDSISQAGAEARRAGALADSAEVSAEYAAERAQADIEGLRSTANANNATARLRNAQTAEVAETARVEREMYGARANLANEQANEIASLLNPRIQKMSNDARALSRTLRMKEQELALKQEEVQNTLMNDKENREAQRALTELNRERAELTREQARLYEFGVRTDRMNAGAAMIRATAGKRGGTPTQAEMKDLYGAGNIRDFSGAIARELLQEYDITGDKDVVDPAFNLINDQVLRVVNLSKQLVATGQMAMPMSEDLRMMVKSVVQESLLDTDGMFGTSFNGIKEVDPVMQQQNSWLRGQIATPGGIQYNTLLTYVQEELNGDTSKLPPDLNFIYKVGTGHRMYGVQ